MKYALLYLATVPVFFAIDMLWLGVIAKNFYRTQMSHMIADQFVWWAAILFYLLFILGILIFAVIPALEAQSFQKAILYGALFGFFTYMTYDLTNLATLRDWPLLLTFVDTLWGTVLSCSVATLSYLIGTRIFS